MDYVVSEAQLLVNVLIVFMIETYLCKYKFQINGLDQERNIKSVKSKCIFQLLNINSGYTMSSNTNIPVIK